MSAKSDGTRAGVSLTHLDDPLFDDAGATKRDLIEYLDGVRDLIIPALEDRPLSVIRVHRGQRPFMQKNVPKYTPEWVRTVTLWAETSKREVSYALCNDRRTLVWFANQRAVEYHPALMRVDRPDRGTQMVLDLDPPDGEFAMAVRVAHVVRRALEDAGLHGAVKTSGAKGVHVFVPIDEATSAPEDVAAATRALAARTELLDPGIATTAFIKDDRGGKVFVDSTRVGGATVVSVFSPRARPGVPVSFPVAWDDLDAVAPGDFTVHTALAQLERAAPWTELMATPQRLSAELVEEGHAIPVARVQAMHEGKRRARAAERRRVEPMGWVRDLARCPVIQAPMGGGPSRPELVAAVNDAGGLGFLAAGYKTADEMVAEIVATKRLTSLPFGVNVFVPTAPTIDVAALDTYLAQLERDAASLGSALGPSDWNDDDWERKLAALTRDPIAVVSFAFGCPTRDVIAELQSSGTRVMVTITNPHDLDLAVERGVDALCLQGIEAGAHRGGFSDDERDDGYGLLALLGATRDRTALPLVAAGGIMDGRDLAAVLGAGADAAQLGTAFVRCPESGASEVHKAALADPVFTTTAITRAFSGRRARGLVNQFMLGHPSAPSAYPEINSATRPLRAEAARRGDPEHMSLWAGQGFQRALARPAGEIVDQIMAGYRDATAGA